MKDKIVSYLKENQSIVVMTLLIVIAVIAVFISLPALLAEMLIALNFILTLTLLVIVFCTEKVKNIYFYPTLVLLFTIFNLTVNVSTTRLIMAKGSEFDGLLINLFSSLIVSSEKEYLVNGLVMFMVIFAFNIIVVTKSCTQVSEVATRFDLDCSQIKLMSIYSEYDSGAITEDETQAKKKEVQEESDFLCALDGASKFVSHNELIRIYIFMMSFIGVIPIGTLLRGESISDTINSCFPLFISSGILCILPAFLVSLGMRIIVTRKI